jgi:hypothetical protein
MCVYIFILTEQGDNEFYEDDCLSEDLKESAAGPIEARHDAALRDTDLETLIEHYASNIRTLTDTPDEFRDFLIQATQELQDPVAARFAPQT